MLILAPMKFIHTRIHILGNEKNDRARDCVHTHTHATAVHLINQPLHVWKKRAFLTSLSILLSILQDPYRHGCENVSFSFGHFFLFSISKTWMCIYIYVCEYILLFSSHFFFAIFLLHFITAATRSRFGWRASGCGCA